jgi:hypothetical protein
MGLVFEPVVYEALASMASRLPHPAGGGLPMSMPATATRVQAQTPAPVNEEIRQSIETSVVRGATGDREWIERRLASLDPNGTSSAPSRCGSPASASSCSPSGSPAAAGGSGCRWS